MLIEFRVRNYRSFAGEQALSLVASNDKTLAEQNTVQTGVRTLPRALRSAVIYGANASGKSNLLRALLLMRGVVLDSAALKPEQKFNVQPFRLDKVLPNEPTLFEITVVLDGVRHQYGFEFTAERVTREWLLVYKSARPQAWFERTFDPESNEDVYEFSSYLIGQKSVWQEATRPNALFLSVAVQLNSEQLAPLHRWFSESLVSLMDGGQLSFDFTTRAIRDPSGARAIVDLMQSADIAINEVRAAARKGFLNEVKFDFRSGESAARREEREVLVPIFRHIAGDYSAEFEYGDESQGTQKLFSLASPLLDIVSSGKVLCVDELDRSLHPLLVRQILHTFHDPEGQSGAQLIFTTHDTSLLEGGILRRDQVWFAEKNECQATELVPLTEFSPRKGEAIGRGYLAGRYGGVPILRERLKAAGSHGEG
jgi:uncharacterized protein